MNCSVLTPTSSLCFEGEVFFQGFSNFSNFTERQSHQNESLVDSTRDAGRSAEQKKFVILGQTQLSCAEKTYHLLAFIQHGSNYISVMNDGKSTSIKVPCPIFN